MTIYLDHASTSWPKPRAVIEAMETCMLSYGANPGRGAHQMARDAGKVIVQTRIKLGELFHIKNPQNIIFTHNATHALNMSLFGFLNNGDHVISTKLEHNSIRRPLEYLRREKGIDITYVSADVQGNLNLDELRKSIRASTRLFAASHSSNLLGSILPIDNVKEILKPYNIKILLDAAQTAGHYPFHIEQGIDLLAFPGHKGLLGPQGTGGLYISPDIDLRPLLYGGTGSQSETIDQPNVRPDRYEAGTPNVVGISGLNEGVKIVLDRGTINIYKKEYNLTQDLIQELQALKGVHILGPEIGKPRTGIVSFVLNNLESSKTAYLLDRDYNIAVRAGYHCTPLSHQTAGTLNTGAVRASFGHDTEQGDIDRLVEAIAELTTLK